MNLFFYAWLSFVEPVPSPSPAPSVVRMLVGDGVLVKIYSDGEVQRSPTTALSAASQVFWTFVDEHNPLRLEVEHLRAENARLRKQCK